MSKLKDEDIIQSVLNYKVGQKVLMNDWSKVHTIKSFKAMPNLGDGLERYKVTFEDLSFTIISYNSITHKLNKNFT